MRVMPQETQSHLSTSPHTLSIFIPMEQTMHRVLHDKNWADVAEIHLNNLSSLNLGHLGPHEMKKERFVIG